jgi:uncharacterized protein (TIGR00251 family)
MYKIRVVPNAKKKYVEANGEVLKVHLTSVPSKGKANEELIELLSKHFGVSKSSVTIVRGLKSRDKVVEIKK